MTEDAAQSQDIDDDGSDGTLTPRDLESVAARVAAYDESLGESVAAARRQWATAESETESLEAEVESLTDRVQRVQADFENYKKRAKQRQDELEARATEDLVERLLDVRDNLERAIEQETDSEVRDGVEATLREFDRVLEEEGVDRIEPEHGADVDPRRHEVLHRETEDADAITDVYRPGYVMADKVLRPAQVTVGPDPGGDDSQSSTSGGTDQPDTTDESA